MHRLVIWGFAIALVPLSIAVVCEAAVLLRGYLAQNQRKEGVVQKAGESADTW